MKWAMEPIFEDRTKFAEAHTNGELMREFRAGKYHLTRYATVGRKFFCVGCREWWREPIYYKIEAYDKRIKIPPEAKLCKVCAYQALDIDIMEALKIHRQHLKRLRKIVGKQLKTMGV